MSMLSLKGMLLRLTSLLSVDITKQIFLKHESFESLRNVLGPEKRARLEAAAVDQIWTGFEEYTEEFYRVITPDRPL